MPCLPHHAPLVVCAAQRRPGFRADDGVTLAYLGPIVLLPLAGLALTLAAKTALEWRHAGEIAAMGR
jgi:hypothetical protein